jgi:hypothetical protein
MMLVHHQMMKNDIEGIVMMVGVVYVDKDVQYACVDERMLKSYILSYCTREEE